MLRAIFIGLFLLGTGCSSSLFTGDKTNDQKIGDGDFNKACFGLNLSNETLDAGSARGLIRCLNSNGSIEGYQQLLDAMSDDQLNALLDVVNNELILNKPRMKALDVSFQQMRGNPNRLNPLFTSMAKVLDNGEFISAALKLLRQGGELNGKIDPEILSTIRLLTGDLESGEGVRSKVRRALDFSVNTFSLPSYNEMVSALKPGRRYLGNFGNYDLEKLSKLALEYSQSKIKDYPHPLMRVILDGLRDGTLFVAFDSFYGPPRGVDAQVRSLELFVQFLSIDRRDVLQKLTELFGRMDAPIECLAGTKQIPNADLHIMEMIAQVDPLEVPQWVTRTNSLKMKLAASMCALPEDFNTLMSVLREIAAYPSKVGNGTTVNDARQLTTIAYFTRGLQAGDEAYARLTGVNKSYRYREFLIHWLGDRTPVNAYRNLTDTLAELSRPEYPFFGNMLYFLNAGDATDRKDFRDLLDVILKERAGHKSVYDVLSKVLLKVGPKEFYNLLSSLGNYTADASDIALPLATASRNAFLMNDVSPLTDVAVSVGKQADTRYKIFFETLFDLAGKGPFEAAIKQTAVMARNGTLEGLMDGLFTIFRRNNENTGPAPALTDVPAVRPSTNPDRDRSVAKRQPINEPVPIWPKNPGGEAGMLACQRLDLSHSLSDPFPGGTAAREKWSSQVRDIAACVNATKNCNPGDQSAFCAAPRFVDFALANEVVSGQHFLGYVVSKAVGFFNVLDGTRQRIFDEFSDLLVENIEDLKRFHKLLTFALYKQYYVNIEPQGLAVIQAANRLMTRITGHAPSEANLKTVLSNTADLVQAQSGPKALGLVWDAYQESRNMPTPAPAVFPDIGNYPIDSPVANNQVYLQLEALIRKYENPSADQINPLMEQKIRAYHTLRQTGFLNFGYRTADEFKAQFKPLLDEAAKGTRLEWLLTFFYTLQSNPYDPQWWSEWFAGLASRVKAIPYYYPGRFPGKDRPTVRLVNQLDLLELVVHEADFSLKSAGQIKLDWLDGYFLKGDDNLALLSLTELALTDASQPDPKNAIAGWIKRRKDEHRFFLDIAETPIIGKLIVPEVHRHLYNLQFILPVLDEMNRGVPVRLKDGRTVVRNELGVLRDFFKSLLSAMPAGDRLKYIRGTHSLTVVNELVKFGFLHTAAQNMWALQADDNGRLYNAKTDASGAIKVILDAIVTTGSNGKPIVNSDLFTVVDYLLRRDGVANVADQSFNGRYQTIGKLVDAVYDWTKRDQCDTGQQCVMTYFKGTASGLGQFFGGISTPELGRNFAKVLRVAISPEYRTLLLNNTEFLRKILATPRSFNTMDLLVRSKTDRDFAKLSEFVHFAMAVMSNNSAQGTRAGMSLLSHLDTDPLKRLNAFSDACDAMGNDPEYVAYERDFLIPTLNKAVHWYADSDTPMRNRIMSYGGTLLRDGTAFNLATFVGRQSSSDQLWKNTRFIGAPEYVADWESFLDVMRYGLEDLARK